MAVTLSSFSFSITGTTCGILVLTTFFFFVTGFRFGSFEILLRNDFGDASSLGNALSYTGVASSFFSIAGTTFEILVGTIFFFFFFFVTGFKFGSFETLLRDDFGDASSLEIALSYTGVASSFFSITVTTFGILAATDFFFFFTGFRFGSFETLLRNDFGDASSLGNVASPKENAVAHKMAAKKIVLKLFVIYGISKLDRYQPY